jgi:VIT1/CCC1 family predicted Fe2+/Mn2+ transporter
MSDQTLRERILSYQRNELTEHHVYRRLAALADTPHNRRILEDIAADELRHYHHWHRYTGQDVPPARVNVWCYYWISRILGLTFGIKLMEHGEAMAQDEYRHVRETIPEAPQIIAEEHDHEHALIGLLDEERLRYIGAIVLGLNDALVELTGGLAGLTLALQHTRLIALSGLIVGVAAALSMGASAYLSAKADAADKQPLRASLYTSTAYLLTVLLLIAPYLLLHNPYVCLVLTLGIAIAIIAAFNYYVAVARDASFRRQFVEMAGISLGVAALSFGVGFALRSLLGVEI